MRASVQTHTRRPVLSPKMQLDRGRPETTQTAAGSTHEREVCDVGSANRYFRWLLYYARVDYHDIGKLGCEPQLNLNTTFEFKIHTFWKLCK